MHIGEVYRNTKKEERRRQLEAHLNAWSDEANTVLDMDIEQLSDFVERSKGQSKDRRADLAVCVLRWLKKNVNNYSKNDLTVIFTKMFIVLLEQSPADFDGWYSTQEIK